MSHTKLPRLCGLFVLSVAWQAAPCLAGGPERIPWTTSPTVEDRLILAGAGLLLTAHFKPVASAIVEGLGAWGYIVVGQTVGANSFLNYLSNARVDDVYNECYGIGCNFIQAEKQCWDRAGELFGQSGQSSVVRVPQSQIDLDLLSRRITPAFARARCN